METRTGRTMLYAIRRGQRVVGHCRGQTIEEAARHWVAREHRHGASTVRTTGALRLSGFFRAYIWDVRTGGMSAHGQPFHVVLA